MFIFPFTHLRYIKKYSKLFLFLLILISCNITDNKYLPDSIGKTDQILIVSDKNLFEKGLKEQLEKSLVKAVPGLPQYEPTVSILFKNSNQFAKILRKYRQIVFISDLSEDNNDMNHFLLKVLGNKTFNEFKAEGKNVYFTKEDAWASPQQLIFLLSPDYSNLLKNIKNHSKDILDTALQFEKKSNKAAIYLPGHDTYISKKINELYDINLDIPKGFIVAREEENFLWLRKDEYETSLNILLYVNTLDKLESSTNNLSLRDKIGEEYILGELPGTYMITDTNIPIFKTTYNLNGHEAIETRGLWRLNKDFMGGAFINYLIIDNIRNKAIMLDGFIYAPKQKKKKYVRRLETIFDSFNLLEEDI